MAELAHSQNTIDQLFLFHEAWFFYLGLKVRLILEKKKKASIVKFEIICNGE